MNVRLVSIVVAAVCAVVALLATFGHANLDPTRLLAAAVLFVCLALVA